MSRQADGRRFIDAYIRKKAERGLEMLEVLLYPQHLLYPQSAWFLIQLTQA